MTATFRITTSYGKDRCYPVNATAKLLCDLSGFKTLLPNTLTIIEDLGFTCLNVINDSTITSQMLYWIMIYLVNKIDFDFEDSDLDYQCDPIYEQRMGEKYLGLWQADNEDELVDIISDMSCLCIKSIDYTTLPQSN